MTKWKYDKVADGAIHLAPDPGTYPYVLLAASAIALQPDDTFLLEADDGSYRETLTFADAVRNESSAVLEWPMPDAGNKFSLKLQLKPRGSSGALELYLFKDRELSLRDGGSSPEPRARLR